MTWLVVLVVVVLVAISFESISWHQSRRRIDRHAVAGSHVVDPIAAAAERCTTAVAARQERRRRIVQARRARPSRPPFRVDR